MSAPAEQLPSPTIIEAMTEPAMFGALFEDGESWRPWFAQLPTAQPDETRNLVRGGYRATGNCVIQGRTDRPGKVDAGGQFANWIAQDIGTQAAGARGAGSPKLDQVEGGEQ